MTSLLLLHMLPVFAPSTKGSFAVIDAVLSKAKAEKSTGAAQQERVSIIIPVRKAAAMHETEHRHQHDFCQSINQIFHD